MPHPRSHTKGQWYWEIHVNPGKAESYQRHSSVTKGQDQLGMGQTVEIHATPMPRRSHTKGQWHRKIHVNPDSAEPHQRHSSLARVQDQLGRGQTEMEIHATAMPRPEGAPLSDVYQLILPLCS
jgi:hypothetical protein